MSPSPSLGPPRKLRDVKGGLSNAGIERHQRVRWMGLPLGELEKVRGIDGRTSVEPTLPTPRPPHQSQPELSGPGRGGRRGRLLQVTWTRADRTPGRAKSFGGGEVEGRRPRGERGDPAWKHQDKGCVRAGAVWKDGEELDHWRRGCGVLTLWVIKSGGGLSRAGARGDGSGGVPEHLGSHFPRSAPTPNTPVPRGAGGAQLVYSWQLTRRL